MRRYKWTTYGDVRGFGPLRMSRRQAELVAVDRRGRRRVRGRR
jgi:hypothetical protein